MNKLYVIVRRDLSKSQQAVQAGHAVAQFLIDCPNSGWTNGTLVYLRGPEGHEGLMDLFTDVSYIEPDYLRPFYEPDIGNEVTAFAVLETKSAISNFFADHQLV